MRVFIDTELSIGQSLVAPDAVQRHVATVLKRRTGDTLTVFNGRGGEFAATITAQSRRELVIRIDTHHAVERESALAITLIQAISRGERMDFSIQKAVELGVCRIVPLVARRTNVRLSPERAASRRAHWLGVIRHACEQCGRNRLPTLTPVHTLDEALGDIGTGVGFVLHPNGGALPPVTTPPASAALIVGPEGGFEDAEIVQIEHAGLRPLGLGPRILRTETATVAGLTVLQAAYGDLSPAPASD